MEGVDRAALSWVEEVGPGVELFAARMVEGVPEGAPTWGPPMRVGGGEDWFVNWADVPSLASANDEQLCAQWLRKTGVDTYAYEVRVSQSADGGRNWGPSSVLHEDGGPGEHGFVSLVPSAASGYRAVWLDGRHTTGGYDQAGAAGAMALYTRLIGLDGSPGPETELDERVCDCCPTSVATTRDGAVWIAYRDRSADEVRDIVVLRGAEEPGGGLTSTVAYTSGDQWKIAGCPVNGPALATDGERVALAWFTLGGAEPAVFITETGSDGFRAPLRLGGDRVLGRVDAIFDSRRRLWVAWLEEDGDRALWRAACLVDGRLDRRGDLARVEHSRASGHARWLAGGDRPLFAYTDVERQSVVIVRVD